MSKMSTAGATNGAKDSLRLVLVGLEGVGKSATGNTILGRDEFQSDISSTCLTLKSEVREAQVFGRQVTMVDTPGLFSSSLSDTEVKEELERALTLCAPGPHVFLIIIQLGRFTEQEKTIAEKLKELLGSDVNSYAMVLFTYGDRLKRKTIDQFVKEDKNLQILIDKCGGQYHVFNNTDMENKMQVSELLVKIDNQLKKRTGRPYFVKALDPHSSLLRIILLGKIGVGKSAAGNTILGDDVFECDLSPSAVTTTCQKITKKVKGRQVAVIDTPGLFDPNLNPQETVNRIKLCIPLSSPGPHAFLVVIQIGSRFTEEDCRTVELFLEIFGKDASKYALVLFTHGDKLGKKSIHEFISENTDLVKVFNMFKRRFHIFNNVVKDSTQVDQLLKKINQMVSENGGGYYTSEMLQKAEQVIEEEKQRILKENEEQNQRQLLALRANKEAQMELRKTQEEEARRKAEMNDKVFNTFVPFLLRLLETFFSKLIGQM